MFVLHLNLAENFIMLVSRLILIHLTFAAFCLLFDYLIILVFSYNFQFKLKFTHKKFHEGIPEGCRIQNFKPGGKHHPFTQHQQHLPVAPTHQAPDALEHHPHRFGHSPVAHSNRRMDPFREPDRNHLMQSHVDDNRPSVHHHQQMMRHHQEQPHHRQHLTPRFHGLGEDGHHRRPHCKWILSKN